MSKKLELNKREIKKISIVCPYYNEESIIASAVTRMVKNLSNLPYDWELIVVNDGSTDSGPEIVKGLSSRDDRLVSVGYGANKGRGFALMRGIDASNGAIIVTTEIDCSWGDDIVKRLVDKLVSEPQTDFVIASPNLAGGGYRNVPLRRIYLSRVGNAIIRAFFTKSVTMNTGMTRAYRRDVIKNLDFDEKDKEFHLEILLKLLTLDYKLAEIPAVLEWKKRKKRYTRLKKHMSGHLKFIVFANPIRYFWVLSIICAITGFLTESYAVIRLARGEVAAYLALLGLSLFLFSLLFFGFGVVTAQNRYVMKELWKTRR